jgi:hypothetical protein
MPVTPFHFGPGALLHAAAPRQVSFIAFCAANVLTDVEPLFYMLTGGFPLHRFFHTLVGAALMTAAVIALFVAARWCARRFWLPRLFGWRELGLPPVALGAALGCHTHIALDSIMHSDIRPLAPFSDANPLLHLVALDMLHSLCLLAGAVGAAVLILRNRSTPPAVE